VQIIEIDETHRCPIKTTTTKNMKVCLWDRKGIPANDGSFGIKSYQPLAHKGTAEWAWQMMLLHKGVSHPDEGNFPDGIDCCKERFIRNYAKTGWQLYTKPEPTKGIPYDVVRNINERITEALEEMGCIEPKPRFEVGQWVDYGGRQGHIVYSDVWQEKRIRFYDGDEPEEILWCNPNVKTIPAHSVVLDFGSGIRGTIIDSDTLRTVNNIIGEFDLVPGIRVDLGNGLDLRIPQAILTQPMRSIVEQLLARQEVEK
jgi:hypothetical protein